MASVKKVLKLLVTSSRGPRKGQKIVRHFKTEKGYSNYLKSGKGEVIKEGASAEVKGRVKDLNRAPLKTAKKIKRRAVSLDEKTKASAKEAMRRFKKEKRLYLKWRKRFNSNPTEANRQKFVTYEQNMKRALVSQRHIEAKIKKTTDFAKQLKAYKSGGGSDYYYTGKSYEKTLTEKVTVKKNPNLKTSKIPIKWE